MGRQHTAVEMPLAMGALLAQARRQRRLLTAIERTFELWGYQPIVAPLLDHAAPHEPFLQTNLRGNVYRLFGNADETLMLVPDITLFLARRIASARPSQEAMRLFYSGSVARRHERADIAGYESLQAGVELIGPRSTEADIEILLLLCETLDRIGYDHFFCHLGSRAFLDAVHVGQPQIGHTELREAIGHRTRDAFRRLRWSSGTSPARIEALWQLFSYIGTGDGLHQRIERAHPTAQERQALEYLVDIFTRLRRLETTELNASHRFRLDLSEVGSQSYHTGIVFQVYIENHNQAVVSGGRYDRLLEHYGTARPSVGFSMFPHALLRGYPEPAPTLEHAGGSDFAARYHDARAKRGTGKATLL